MTAREVLKRLGPGVVAGAADNDPTTVATMSVAGATTGFALSWLVLLVYPMLASAQVAAAAVGSVTRMGMQELVRVRYGPAWGAVLLTSVLVVTLASLAADLEAGAAALGLVTHVDLRWFVVPYALLIAGILAVGGYNEIQRVLRYAVLAFVAYVGAAFLARPNWGAIAGATFHPRLPTGGQSAQAALAILGTTLTSYAYFWEVQEEAESRQPLPDVGLAEADAGVGMLLAVAIFWFELIATGATLGAHHKSIQTAQDAAQALQPVAGPAAAYLFALGLFASSFIAVPVLAATCGYVIANEVGRPASLNHTVRRAPLFYGVIAASLGLATGVSLLGVDSIKLLFWSSILGGLGTPISLAFLLVLARDRGLMREHRVSRVWAVIGWLTVAVTAIVGLDFLWMQLAAPALRRL
jgi:Mn2+/Fe2+ NRAMP family transporter